MKKNTQIGRVTCLKKNQLFLLFFILLFVENIQAKTFNFPNSDKNLTNQSILFRMKYDQQHKSLRDDNKVYGEGVSATLKSLVVPGWGLAKTSTGPLRNAFYLFAPVVYISAISGVVANGKSKTAYKEYLAATDQTIIDEKFETATNKRAAYINRIGFAMFVYSVQAGMTLIWGRHNDIYRQRAKNWKENMAFNCAPYYDLRLKSVAVRASFCYNFGIRKKDYSKKF